jgi:hypothetical protein
MANFGALTDHFGLGSTSGFELVDSSATPRSMSRADAQDANGDIADAAWHGNTTAALKDASCTYALKSGTLATGTVLKLGQLAAGKIALSVEVATSNGGWPQITVSGVIGPSQTLVLEQVKTYALPAYTISGKKQAQLMGVTIENGRLTDCSMSASCDWAQQDDGQGEPVAYGVSGAVATASATAVAVSAESPELAAAEGWTASQDSGLEESQASWHTASISVEKVLDVAIAT